MTVLLPNRYAKLRRGPRSNKEEFAWRLFGPARIVVPIIGPTPGTVIPEGQVKQLNMLWLYRSLYGTVHSQRRPADTVRRDVAFQSSWIKAAPTEDLLAT